MSLLINPFSPFSPLGAAALNTKLAPSQTVDPLAGGGADPSPASPYGSLAGISPDSIASNQGQYANVPLPVPRPLVLTGGQGGGGDTQPSQAPQAAPMPAAAPTYQASAAPTYPVVSPVASAPTSSGSSPFSTKDPNSFISKIFGPTTASQQPLVRPNSIVGRIAHLFMT